MRNRRTNGCAGVQRQTDDERPKVAEVGLADSHSIHGADQDECEDELPSSRLQTHPLEGLSKRNVCTALPAVELLSADSDDRKPECGCAPASA